MNTTTAVSIRERLESPAFHNELAKLLPRHITPDRMARAFVTAIMRTPELAKCDQVSFFKAAMDLSAWGLEPDGRRAHLIPFRNTKRNTTEVQLIIDYKGLVELAFRSGVVSKIHADVIRQGDLLDYSMGELRQHVPWFLRNDEDKPHEAGEIVAAYCVVTMAGGVTKCELMAKDEIESIRLRSRAGNVGPWKTDWCEMAKKTAFRRVSKWLPLSSEIRDAFDRDDDRLEHRPTIQPRPARVVSDLAGITQELVASHGKTEPQPVPVPTDEDYDELQATIEGLPDEAVAEVAEIARQRFDDADWIAFVDRLAAKRTTGAV